MKTSLSRLMAAAAIFGSVVASHGVAAQDAAGSVAAGIAAWEQGDDARAVDLWRAPAQAGDVDAQFNLAQAYRLGRGVAIDLAEAERLYAAAARQGHRQAADNYGILLYQRGAREEAMPYLTAASDRGDPRAHYLVGLAHFNADLLPRDWERAYALLMLAKADGLPQAETALTQMEAYIPAQQRDAGSMLAQVMQADIAERLRSAAAEEASARETPPMAARAETPAPVTPPVQSEPAPAGSQEFDVAFSSGEVVQELPASPPAAAAAPREPSKPSPAPTAKTVANTAPATSGPWAVQVGAFGNPDNVGRMWARVSRKSYFANARRVTGRDGPLTVLYAAGFASQAAAKAACAASRRDGIDCLVVKR